VLVPEADVDNENDPMLGIVSSTVVDRTCIPVACDSDDVPELRLDMEALSVIVGKKALRVCERQECDADKVNELDCERLGLPSVRLKVGLRDKLRERLHLLIERVYE
jgi:hypothetical protein